MNIFRFGVRRPISTMMLFLGIFLLGAISYFHLPLDIMPEITFPSISVLTAYPGASPQDVEERVTKPIENVLSIVPDVVKLTSLSRESLSVVTLKFSWGTDLDEAANDVRDKLDLVLRELPEDAEKPLVFKFDIAELPILIIGASARESYPRLRKIIEKRVVEPLQRIKGVGTLLVQGGLKREIQVYVDRDKLQSLGLGIEEVIGAIRRENINLPAGNIKVGLYDYLLRVEGEFKSLEDISRIGVALRRGRIVRLGEIARVEDSFKEATRRVHVEGERGLIVLVQKQSGANTVEVTRRIIKKLEGIIPSLPPDIKILTIRNTAEFILSSLKNLAGTLLWGGFLVSLLVVIFLGDFRASMIVILTLPFSLIFSFIFLYLRGYSLNWISLSSLVIALGMVVDGTIVVLESIYRYREQGKGREDSAEKGAEEVGRAVSASYFTTIAIFVPLIFARGIIGIMFHQMAWVIIVVLLGSLLVSLTLSPMLASRILIRIPRRKKWVVGMEERYKKVLSIVLNYPGKTLLLIFLFLIFSLLLYPFIKKEFFPYVDQGWVQCMVKLPVGTRVEETEKVLTRMEDIARKEVSEREGMASRAGYSEEGYHTALGWEEGPHIGMLFLDLVPKNKRKRSSREIAEALRKKFSSLPGIEELTFQTQDPLEELILGGEKPVTVKIFGDNLEITDQIAEKVKKIMEEIPGLTDVEISRKKGRPEIEILIDRDKSFMLGSGTGAVARELRDLFQGRKVTRFREEGEEYDIRIRLGEENRQIIQDIMNAPVKLVSGRIVPLKTLAKIRLEKGPLTIEREGKERLVKVGGYLKGRKLSEVIQDLREKLRDFLLPEGVRIQISGAIEEQEKAFRILLFSLILGMILVYMVMASQFESLLHPLIIMFSVPFALIGVLWILFLTHTTINVNSLLGTVILIGIVVNNGIILIDYTNQLRRRGEELREAVIKAGLRRVRPVVMTSLTTIFGLLPLALMRGEGSEEWNSLGIAAIGGLTLSTLVTLILIPTVYYLLERRKTSLRKGGRA